MLYLLTKVHVYKKTCQVMIKAQCITQYAYWWSEIDTVDTVKLCYVIGGVFVTVFYSIEYIRDQHLILSMLNCEPAARPTAAAILTHPFFWNREKQLQFFQVINNY